MLRKFAVVIFVGFWFVDCVIGTCQDTRKIWDIPNDPECVEEAEHARIDLLPVDGSPIVPLAIESDFEVAGANEAGIWVSKGRQTLVFDPRKKTFYVHSRGLTNNRAFSFEAFKKVDSLFIRRDFDGVWEEFASNAQNNPRKLPLRPETLGGPGCPFVFDPRDQWFSDSITMSMTLENDEMVDLAGMACVHAFRKKGKLHSVWSNTGQLGVKRVTELVFSKTKTVIPGKYVLEQVRLFPSIRGEFSWEKVQKMSALAQFEVVNRLTWPSWKTKGIRLPSECEFVERAGRNELSARFQHRYLEADQVSVDSRRDPWDRKFTVSGLKFETRETTEK